METLENKKFINIDCNNPISRFDTHLGGRNSICADEVVKFTNNSLYHKYSEWKIKESGSTQTMTTLNTLDFERKLNPGTYTIELHTYNGCATKKGEGHNMKSITLTVNDIPLISIDPMDTIICNGNSLTLTAIGEAGQELRYHWNTGAHTKSITITPTVTKTYTVTVTDINGCSNNTSSLVSVLGDPVANVVMEPLYKISQNSYTHFYCKGQTVTFKNTSTNFDRIVQFMLVTNKIVLNNWKTDTLISTTTANSFSYTFNDVGSYAVIISVGNSCPFVAALATNFSVYDVPTLSITPDDTTICVGNSVTLTASGADSYFWNTGETTNSINVTPTSTFTYSITGINAAGCSGNASSLVTVHDNSAPVASIGISPGPYCVGQTITFTNTSTNFAEVQTFQLCRMIDTGLNYWSGNNVCEVNNTTQKFNHTLLTAGFYKIALTVRNTCGVITAIADTFWVHDTPAVRITPSDTTICVGNSITLTASSTDSYLWNTGETTNSIIVTPTSTFTYSITGINAAGCSGNASSLVTVRDNSAPVASIGIFPLPDFCLGQEVNFSNSSFNSDEVTVFQICRMTNQGTWAGNDCEINNTDSSFNHIFDNAGFYKVHLTVKNVCGLESQIARTFSVNDLSLECWVELSASGSGIRFAAKASGGSMPYTFSFNGKRVYWDYSIASISGNFTNAIGDTAYSNWYDYMPGFDGKFMVTDANGCSQICEILDYQAPPFSPCIDLSLSCSLKTDTWNGKNYITYSSSASGGSGNYEYTWKFICVNPTMCTNDEIILGQNLMYELNGTWCPSDWVTSVTVNDLNSGCSQTCDISGFTCKTGSTITLEELIANNAGKESVNSNTGLDNEFHVNIYPNPAFDNVSIEYYYDNNTDLTYQITDITGKILKEGNLPRSKANTTIDLLSLSEGIYLLNIKTIDRVIERRKLIKI